ncbi:TrbM/KikA/MpfK family conjugal transfer protein [Gluconacetobacter diazotrophicus]|nr:TrbM/KikA/MpfK family conjugal transfer protein [Gluconacetobacter diazotrophicus]
MTKRFVKWSAPGLLALAIGLLATPVPAKAADPCTVLVCMAGMAGIGSPSGGCGDSIGHYFSIIRFGFWGYSPSKTAAARLRYLNSCPGAAANEGTVMLIQTMYGAIP